MTFPSPLLVDVRRRDQARSVVKGATVTAALVAVGAAVAMWTLPAVPLHALVGKAYVEARYTGQWTAAWEMLCAPGRSPVGSFPAFVEDATYWDTYLHLPSDFDVAVSDVHAVPGWEDPAATMTVTVTSDEKARADWRLTGELLVLLRDGRWRVCDGGLSSD